MPVIKSALLPLQAALKTLLSGALGTGIPVYDDVPEESRKPYVVIGDQTMIGWFWKLTGGTEITTTIHIWSEYRGRYEVETIKNTIMQSVTGNEFNLIPSGFNCLPAVFEFGETFQEPDGITRHGILRFRVNVQQLS